MAAKSPPLIRRDDVVRLWLHRQGFDVPRGTTRLGKRSLTKHLERTGALQLDSINVLDRAHYLTLWSRFGTYDRRRLDRWIYRDKLAYEYWGHEASILPVSALPLSRRRMARFPPPNWRNASWWKVYKTSAASKQRILRRLREHGPLESADFERPSGERRPAGGGSMPLQKEDNRTLRLLWHGGKIAVHSRRHFRRVYDLADRVYPEGPAATTAEYEDHWLLVGLSGNGVASERHLVHYDTSSGLKAPDRKRVIVRNVKKKRVVEVRVDGQRGTWYALPEHLDGMSSLAEPEGTTLVCPFDSFLWQRQRAEDLLDFVYRIEIYVPPAKREFGYYVLPILHDGRLVGRLDPKLHREDGVLEVKKLRLEKGVKRDRRLERGIAESLQSLAEFLGADRLKLPRGWTRLG